MLYQTVCFQILKPIDQSWADAGKLFRDIQYINAKAMNFAITELYKWEIDKVTFHDQNSRWATNEEMPKPNIWQKVRKLFPDLPTVVVDQLTQTVSQKWQTERNEVLFNRSRSLSSFRKDYPLAIRARGCKLQKLGDEVIATFSLRPKSYEQRQFKFILATQIDDHSKLTMYHISEHPPHPLKNSKNPPNKQTGENSTHFDRSSPF